MAAAATPAPSCASIRSRRYGTAWPAWSPASNLMKPCAGEPWRRSSECWPSATEVAALYWTAAGPCGWGQLLLRPERLSSGAAFFAGLIRWVQCCLSCSATPPHADRAHGGCGGAMVTSWLAGSWGWRVSGSMLAKRIGSWAAGGTTTGSQPIHELQLTGQADLIQIEPFDDAAACLLA